MWQSLHSERSASLAIGGNRSSAAALAAAPIERISDAAIRILDILFSSWWLAPLDWGSTGAGQNRGWQLERQIFLYRGRLFPPRGVVEKAS